MNNNEYNFEDWKKQIYSLNLRVNNLEDLITLIDKFQKRDTFYFFPVTNNKLREAFNNICLKDFLITYDVEFQNILANNNDDFIIGSSQLFDQSSFIREIGILFFLRNYQTKEWFFIGDVFINFPSLVKMGFEKDEVRMIDVGYSAVNDKTREKMEQNEENFVNDNFIESYLDRVNQENKINFILKNKKNIIFEIFRKFLNKNQRRFFDNQWRMYLEDSNVRDRTIKKNDISYFMEMFTSVSKNSTFLVKGKRDIEAFINIARYLDDFEFEFILSNSNYYDIEIFNNFSRNFFGNAKLETTYKAIIETQIYKENAKSFFDMLRSRIGERAHNPLSDSLFTLIVAAGINLSLNYYFEEIDRIEEKVSVPNFQLGGAVDKKYYKKYYQYKLQYLFLKNKI